MFRWMILLSFLCIFGAIVNAQSEPKTAIVPVIENGRLIVSREQIHLTADGIFVNISGHFVAVNAIYATHDGKYSCEWDDWIVYCRNGHPYFAWQTGCSVDGCPYYSGNNW